jgi:hypothetical protein
MRRCAAAKAPPRALPAAPNFRNPAENQRGIYVHYLFYVRNMFFCEFWYWPASLTVFQRFHFRKDQCEINQRFLCSAFLTTHTASARCGVAASGTGAFEGAHDGRRRIPTPLSELRADNEPGGILAAIRGFASG